MLSAGKKATEGTGKGYFTLGLKASVAMFAGGLAMLASGMVAPAAAGTGGNDFAKMGSVSLYRLVGVAQASATGSGVDGAVLIDIKQGDWLCKNSAGVDAITVAQIGHYCFVADDETVAKTSAFRTRPRAGVVVAVDATGVMVRIAPEISAAAERYIHLPFLINATDLAAPTTQEFVSPVSGSISRLTGIVQVAIVTGGDLTVNLDATPVAGLTCTFADAAPKGTIVTDTPTAGDATTMVAAGQRIQLVPSAPFSGGGAIGGILEIAY